ncbi:DUF6233 domain-containing protein [Streptomyces canus]|uniref:DUF6233 domain-containing protein n=1 Tax=Streptomyces canus TaxID=58343 RepID=UPI003253AFE4
MRVWHALWLNRIDAKITLLERRKTEEEHGRRTRPQTPEWLVEVGTGKPPVQVHADTCHMIGSRHRPVSRDEARRLLTEGLHACTHCQPDTQLHIIDLAARGPRARHRPPHRPRPRRLLTPAAAPSAALAQRLRPARNTSERAPIPGSVRAAHPAPPTPQLQPGTWAKRPQRGCLQPDHALCLW